MPPVRVSFPVLMVVVLTTGCGPEREGDVGSLRQPLPSTSLVISQVFGSGGAIGTPSPPPYRTDFLELHNVSGQAVSLGSFTVQYASSMGTNWLVADFDPGAMVPAGGYHLVAFPSGMTTRGAPLPTPDTTNPLIDLARVDFKLALVDGVAPLTLACPLAGAEAMRVVDFVGAGSANCFEGARDAGTPPASVTTGLVRKNDGCLDTDVNADDFETTTPTARNAASPVVVCLADGGSSGTPDAGVVMMDAGLDAGGLSPDAGVVVDAASRHATLPRARRVPVVARQAERVDVAAAEVPRAPVRPRRQPEDTPVRTHVLERVIEVRRARPTIGVVLDLDADRRPRRRAAEQAPSWLISLQVDLIRLVPRPVGVSSGAREIDAVVVAIHRESIPRVDPLRRRHHRSVEGVCHALVRQRRTGELDPLPGCESLPPRRRTAIDRARASTASDDAACRASGRRTAR